MQALAFTRPITHCECQYQHCCILLPLTPLHHQYQCLHRFCLGIFATLTNTTGQGPNHKPDSFCTRRHSRRLHKLSPTTCVSRDLLRRRYAVGNEELHLHHEFLEAVLVQPMAPFLLSRQSGGGRAGVSLPQPRRLDQWPGSVDRTPGSGPRYRGVGCWCSGPPARRVAIANQTRHGQHGDH